MGARRRTSLLYIALVASGALASSTGCGGCGKKSGAGSSGAGGGGNETTPGMSIPTPPARGAYVTNNASDTISVFDRDGDTVTHVPVDLDKDAHEAPHHLAIDPTTKNVFVALAFPPEAKPGKPKDPHAAHGNADDVGKLARLDLATLAVRETREVDENPGDVVLTHDRTRVLVTHFDMKRAMDVAARGGGSPSTMFAHLVVFEARSMKKIGSRAVCVAPHGVVTTKDDKTAFVACYGSDELGIVDLASGPASAEGGGSSRSDQEGFPVSRIPLGSAPGVPGVPRYGPYSTTLTPDEKRVVVADLEGQDLRVFDRETKKFVPDKTVVLSSKAFMPAFVDDHTLLVPLQAPDGLARVDLDTSKVVRRTSFTRDQCGLPHVVRIAKDGRAYLVCEGDHKAPGTVLEIDKETLAVKKSWTVGAYPDGLAFGDD